MKPEDWLAGDDDTKADEEWSKQWQAAWAIALLGAKQVQTAGGAAKIAEAMDSLLQTKTHRAFLEIERGKGW